MAPLLCLPSSTKARLALAGVLTAVYIVVTAFYMSVGRGALTQLPDDLGHPAGVALNHQNDAEGISLPTPPRILLVSAFFPVNTSKTTPAEYDGWLAYFLGTVTTDVHVYTPPSEAERLRALRAPGMPLIIDTNFTTLFEIPPLRGKEDAYLRNRVQGQAPRSRRPIEVYALRNAPPYFLAAASAGKGYDYAFYIDPTSFRSAHAYTAWPAPARVADLWAAGASLTGTPATDLLFFPTRGTPHASLGLWTPFYGALDTALLDGAFFGGSPSAAAWWAAAFYAQHDWLMAQVAFIGAPDSVANVLAVVHPERVLTVWPGDPMSPAAVEGASLLGQCGSVGKYYQFFLADATTQDAMRAKWIEGASHWRWWGWWRARETAPCRVTRSLGIRDLLARIFGGDWRPPAPVVEVPTVDWTLI